MKLGTSRSLKEHRIKGKQYMTMMFITDATKDIKSVKIPKWIRFPLSILAIFLIWQALQFYMYVEQLETEVAEHERLVKQVEQISQSKDGVIDDLESELTMTKEDRYKELVRLQDLAVELGVKLKELEAYRSEMEEFKEEIDTNLNTDTTEPISGIEKETRTSSVDLDKRTLLGFNPEFMEVPLTASPLEEPSVSDLLANSIERTEVDYDSVDFEGEIAKLNDYLDIAFAEINSDSGHFEATTEALEGMIPYLEAYPSVLPIEDTYITSPFGYRKNPFGGYSSEFHTGVDLKASYEPVAATGAGTVIEAKYLSGYGYTVIIDHGYGISTKYAHNSKLYVEVGDKVKRGDIISKSGNSGRSTGPHLHYEVLLDGEPQNPLDYIYEENN